MLHTTDSSSIEKNRSTISRMFDQISDRYDLVNRLLSFGQDVRWRKMLIRYFPNRDGLRYLDLATGTADVMLTARSVLGNHRFASALGIDISDGMLSVGRKKFQSARLDPSWQLKIDDATCLKVEAQSVDVVTMVFGIRNASNSDAVLNEMYRVLDMGGRTLIMEFALPRNWFFRWGYLQYFRYILPILGGWISGKPDAYRYLNRSVEAFDYGDAFAERMQRVGFDILDIRSLCFGVAMIYVGEKRKSRSMGTSGA